MALRDINLFSAASQLCRLSYEKIKKCRDAVIQRLVLLSVKLEAFIRDLKKTLYNLYSGWSLIVAVGCKKQTEADTFCFSNPRGHTNPNNNPQTCQPRALVAHIL